MYGFDGSGWGVGGWIVMAILMVLFWGAVVTVFVLIFRHRTSPDAHAAPSARSHASAEQILAERFARGEIDESEYRARRATLRGAE